MRRLVLALASLVSIPIALYACAEDDTAVPGPKDASAAEAAAVDASDAGTDASALVDATDGKTPPAIRCTDADFDRACDLAGGNGGSCVTEGEVAITFNTSAAPTQYQNRCVKVKAGTVVAFQGSFFQHPLEPAGGDVPTPIPTVMPKTAAQEPAAGDAGTPEVRVTTSAAGTFGFQCTYHPVQMFGAIRVVP